MLIRFDDISDNTDFAKLHDMMLAVFAIPNARVLLCLSPFCSSDATDGWVFPRRLMALSEVSEFFKMNTMSHEALSFCKVQSSNSRVLLAGHGAVHVDHRLLCKQAQEISICLSSCVVGALTFVPPFNKWNSDTEEVCKKHGIRLVKFEDGWRHVLYNTKDSTFSDYYLHVCDMSLDQFKRWLE